MRHDDGNNFDTILDRFVAPTDGVYHFEAHLVMENIEEGKFLLVNLRKNGLNTSICVQFDNNDLTFSCGGSALMKLAAGDFVDVRISSNDSLYVIVGGTASTFFSRSCCSFHISWLRDVISAISNVISILDSWGLSSIYIVVSVGRNLKLTISPVSLSKAAPWYCVSSTSRPI